MSRSLKKPPFVHYKLFKRVEEAQASNSKAVIKTWSRASTITPDFVGLTIAVHNGNKFIPVFVTDPERSQVREIAETRLDKIETPITPDRDAWIQRLSQFHWSHHELRDGTAWAHMRKFVEK